MAFDKDIPPAGIPARQLDNDTRANFQALETLLAETHGFPTNTLHKDGLPIYTGSSAPTTKEDGVTALAATDIGTRLWFDESQSPPVLKVMTGHGPVVFTSVMQRLGMLDEDNMASDDDTVPASQQSVKAYADLHVAKTGSTMSGVLNMGSNLISLVTDPVGAQDAATKAYVDAKAHVVTNRSAGTYTGDQASGNNSSMTNAQSISSLGFDPDEVTIYCEEDNRQTWVKTSTMATDSAMGMSNDDYSDFIIEFISGGFKVNRRDGGANQTTNTNLQEYHFVAKKHA